MGEFVVEWPTLWVVPSWVEAHCPVPDGFRKGQPFEMAGWQLWATLNHYRVVPEVPWVPDRPVLGPAFQHRESLVVGPQKLGKGPWSATICAAEGVGPVLFAGWSTGVEVYRCRDHGCGCGWEYRYDVGEAMGMPWPTPLIQLTATSEDQVQNVYRPLKAMIRGGPLADLMRVTESFIALPNDGRIDVVTASATSRLGAPLTFFLDDETGLYTKTNKLHGVHDTQARGVAGMGGRGLQTTNCWDPSQQSTAQETFESTDVDVFRFYRKPPTELNYLVEEDRRKIHAFNYEGSDWVPLDSIDKLADSLVKRDPAQAERFLGNRMVYGQGSWMPADLWEQSESSRGVAA